MATNPNTANPANDNPAERGSVTISFKDLAKGLGRDEDDLLRELAGIFAAREAEPDAR